MIHSKPSRNSYDVDVVPTIAPDRRRGDDAVDPGAGTSPTRMARCGCWLMGNLSTSLAVGTHSRRNRWPKCGSQTGAALLGRSPLTLVVTNDAGQRACPTAARARKCDPRSLGQDERLWRAYLPSHRHPRRITRWAPTPNLRQPCTRWCRKGKGILAGR